MGSLIVSIPNRVENKIYLKKTTLLELCFNEKPLEKFKNIIDNYILYRKIRIFYKSVSNHVADKHM